ncbi:MAG TPA: ATP-binding protein [Chloroflexaceae bacterium]|nr:ATP-binding protein [Chloroflexaceae bacterium]
MTGDEREQFDLTGPRLDVAGRYDAPRHPCPASGDDPLLGAHHRRRVRQLLVLHGDRGEVSSRPGSGCTFQVTLPLSSEQVSYVAA